MAIKPIWRETEKQIPGVFLLIHMYNYILKFEHKNFIDIQPLHDDETVLTSDARANHSSDLKPPTGGWDRNSRDCPIGYSCAKHCRLVPGH